ncbi:MAG: TlyA family rRNA (cytidine-2'-O)-methyltransferase [Dehalococcoidia bacterium]|nr:TlyA family rRNA (cytidine-2'-O)-methyltransferase [Dehalococcoidia bacterium]
MGGVSILACVAKTAVRRRNGSAPGPGRSRIDALLVERGLVESRQQAQAVLMAGSIRVDGATVTKPGSLVAPSAAIEVLRRPAFVSRGGEKLEHALTAFGLDVEGMTCVDAGASTGGFTDCLLQRGARRVYAVDVGYGVLDYKLRQDERVVVMERTNARDLSPLPEACDLATFDVAFIGVEKVIPAVTRSLRPGAHLVVLVKPQFQGRREEVGKKGVVKDPLTHAAVIGRLVAWTATNGLRLQDLTASPILGPAGNKEFFLHLRLESAPGA